MYKEVLLNDLKLKLKIPRTFCLVYINVKFIFVKCENLSMKDYFTRSDKSVT